MSVPDSPMEESQARPDVSSNDDVESHLEIRQVATASWSAPLPPPDALERYEALIPGAADRIFKMAENAQERRYASDRMSLEIIRMNLVRRSWRSYLGMALGFVLAMTGIICGTYLAANGHSASGMALFVASLASLVGVSVYGIKVQSAERRRDSENAEEE